MRVPNIVQENRRLRVSQYKIPGEIHLKGDRLFWQPVKEWKQVKPTTETFERFLDLAGSSDDAILRFAQEWGVLWLCKEHTEPVSDVQHWKCIPLNPDPADPPETYSADSAKVWRKYFASEGEPTSTYRRWSRLAGAVLRICERHDDGKPAAAADWQILWDDRWFVKGDQATWTQDPKWSHWDRLELLVEKSYMVGALNRWLEIGNVRPRIVPDDKGDPTLTLGVDGLFGTLAVSLLESAGNYVVAGCTGCRRFYRPSMRPKSGQDRYCQICRDAKIPEARANHRKALRRQEERKKKRPAPAPKR